MNYSGEIGGQKLSGSLPIQSRASVRSGTSERVKGSRADDARQIVGMETTSPVDDNEVHCISQIIIAHLVIFIWQAKYKYVVAQKKIVLEKVENIFLYLQR